MQSVLSRTWLYTSVHMHMIGWHEVAYKNWLYVEECEIVLSVCVVLTSTSFK